MTTTPPIPPPPSGQPPTPETTVTIDTPGVTITITTTGTIDQVADRALRLFRDAGGWPQHGHGSAGFAHVERAD